MQKANFQVNQSFGPPVYENWIAAIEGKPSNGAQEYELYTDAHITGEITKGCGPYQLLNLVPFPTKFGHAQATITLRLEIYMENSSPSNMTQTDTDRYHGGTLVDEIAALASLALGIRLKAGGLTRTFDPTADPRGKPLKLNPQSPVLLTGLYGRVLPLTTGTHSLTDLDPLTVLPKLSPDDAVALVRAARLYQDAIWIAESEPSLSWVMLASAVETAANHWRKSSDTPIKRLKDLKPELVTLLEDTGIKDLGDKVAYHIVDTLKSTQKFLNFIMEFLPPPPSKRPPEWVQLEWFNAMKKTMSKIYDYRSKALHEGRPFPAPMCEPPMHLQEWDAPAEKPIGLAMSTMGGTWLAKDTPMLLHTFEYIVRHVLLAWWKSMSTIKNAHEYDSLKKNQPIQSQYK